MLPTTILLGLAFPIGLTLWAGDSPSEDTSRRAGSFYSLNVLGAILGSVLAGFVLLPQFGTRTSLIAVAALATLSSILLAISSGRPDRRWRSRSRVVVAAAVPDRRARRGRSVRRRLRALPSIRNAGLARGRRADHGGRARSPRQPADAGDVSRRQPPGQRFAGRRFVHHRIGALPAMLHPNPSIGAGRRPRRRRHARRGRAPQRSTSTSSSSRRPSSPAPITSSTSTSTCSSART